MNDYAPSVFKGISKEEIDEALEMFQTVDASPGTVLIAEGDVDPTVAIVDSGELTISTGGTILGRAGVGDVIGEMALFGSGLRSATVTAALSSRLLVLSAEGFDALRATGHPVTTAIEEHSLHALTNRLRGVSDRIAALAYGQDEDDYTPAPGFFDRVATAIGSGGILFPGLVDGAEILEKSRLFAGVPRDLLEDVAKHFHPMAARRGHFLCTEGESGNDMFILASGEVAVAVATADDRVEQLAKLTAGDAFGMCALLQPENPRMASCIAQTKVVALSMGRLTFAGLVPQNSAVASVLRVAMIRSMADQLCYANAQLALLDAARQRSERTEREVEAVMRAAAAMETYGDYLGNEGASMPYLYE